MKMQSLRVIMELLGSWESDFKNVSPDDHRPQFEKQDMCIGARWKQLEPPPPTLSLLWAW